VGFESEYPDQPLHAPHRLTGKLRSGYENAMFKKLLHQLTTPPAHQVGKRNLERAWRAMLNGDMEKARTYNTRAAKAYQEMLAHDQDRGRQTFPARLAAAGISLLRDGNPKEAASLLDQALERQEVLFPAYAWAGLAHGHIGDEGAASRYWKKFSTVQAGQPVLGKILHEQQQALNSNMTSLAEACRAVEHGILKQDKADYREGRGFWLLKHL